MLAEKKSGCIASETNRTDDIVLSSGALRNHHDAGYHPNQPDRGLLGRGIAIPRFGSQVAATMARPPLHSFRASRNDNEELAVTEQMFCRPFCIFHGYSGNQTVALIEIFDTEAF
jgi:hypothetical protein